MKQKFPERSIYLKWLATAIPMAGNLRGSLFGYLFLTGTKGEQFSRFTTISRILGLLLKLRDIFLSNQYNYLSHLCTVDKRL